MRAWRKYFVAVDIKPDAIWSAQCLRQNAESYNNAINYCRVFPLDYVQYSERPRLTLAKGEYVMERSVKAAYSVVKFWTCVVLEADATVLEETRRGNPEMAGIWKLTCDYGKRGTGPVWEVSMTFPKVETTAADVWLILGTLWARGDHIPYTPRARVAFHSVVLAASIGGFRPGTLINFPYEQVSWRNVRLHIDF